jgi:hypothetical protein
MVNAVTELAVCRLELKSVDDDMPERLPFSSALDVRARERAIRLFLLPHLPGPRSCVLALRKGVTRYLDLKGTVRNIQRTHTSPGSKSGRIDSIRSQHYWLEATERSEVRPSNIQIIAP